MKLQIIILALIMITIVGAVDVYSGEDYTFASEQFDYYTIAGNQSSLEGMEVNWNEGITTISFSPTYQSDSFTLILFNEKEVIRDVEVQVGRRGGGGTRTIYKDKIITEYVDREVTTPPTIVSSSEVDSNVSEEGIIIWLVLFIFVAVLFLVWALYKIFNNTT